MKFQKGSKVEVMNKTELPTSWCVAEVVSGNKYTYNLRYDCYPGVEKVSRDFIRPCPPRAKHLQSWVVGNIVEVFDDNSWKTATVCKVSDGDHFSLRPHGFTHEIIVHGSDIRERQSWQDGQWLPIVKISGKNGDVNFSQMVEPNGRSKFGLKIPMPDSKTCQEKDNNNILVYNDAGLHLQESRVVSCKTLKRASPFCSSHLEAFTDYYHYYGKKPRKIDAIASSEDKQIQASFVNELEKERLSETNDSDNDQCSVGSCSVFASCVNIETDILSSDAESYNTWRDEDGNYSSTPQEGFAESIHRLELHAYRSTLEALYASGPLSWEKEALLTNLRINLHISNDEHLTELRNLISAGAVTYTYIMAKILHRNADEEQIHVIVAPKTCNQGCLQRRDAYDLMYVHDSGCIQGHKCRFESPLFVS